MESLTFKWKEIVSTVLAAMLNFAAFWLWHRELGAIVEGNFEAYRTLIFPVVALIFAAVSFAFVALFIESAKLSYTSVAIAVGTPYFLLTPTMVVVGAFGASILLGIFAVRKIRKEYSLSLGFSAAKTLKDGLPLYFTIAALIVSVMYAAMANNQDITSLLIPRPLLNYTLQTLTKNETLVKTFDFPQFSPDTTVDQVMLQFVQKELSAQGIAPSKIPKDQLSKLLQEQRSALAAQYGLHLTGSEKMGDVFSNAIAGFMGRILGPYARFVPLVAVAAFFLAFKTLSIILYYFALFFVFIFIKLFIATGILRRITKTIDVEKLSF